MTPARVVFGLLVVTTLVLFLVPVTPSGPENSDKVGHVVSFATLAVCGRWARIPVLPLTVGLAAYAVLTEVLQGSIPSLGRYGDPADVVADLVGIALGLVVGAALLRSGSARQHAGPGGV